MVKCEYLCLNPAPLHPSNSQSKPADDTPLRTKRSLPSQPGMRSKDARQKINSCFCGCVIQIVNAEMPAFKQNLAAPL
jgi:hypothetical protein